MEQEVNSLFCRENVEKIVVPDVVKNDLLSFIEEKLKKAGFYYRIAYRVKAVDSMTTKLIFKDYGRPGTENEDKKMQDLIGIRIIMYFADDLTTCRNLLDTLFSEPGEWTTTDNNEYEFKAMKVNGIFKLPAYLHKVIKNPMLSEYIDDTFEVQVRTNSFEGWHEIEHDLRYKGSAFGIGNESLARKMNSILATLELCDDSIVKLLEDLGHAHYKDHKWEDMIRCHYRLKLINQPMSQELVDIFDKDTDLAKCFFKFDRNRVTTKLWNDTSAQGMELTVDSVIRIVNEISLKDHRLTEAFEQIEKRNKGSREGYKRKKFEPFKQLGEYKVFQADVELRTHEGNLQETWEKAVGYIYAWIKTRFDEVFPELPETVSDFCESRPGFLVKLKYDEENMVFEQRSAHYDTNVAGRMWTSTAEVKKVGDKIRFKVGNEFEEPESRFRDAENTLFSRPNFFGEIADNIGIIDVERLRENVRKIGNFDDFEKLEYLILNQERKFPVVTFLVTDPSWTDKFDVGYFTYLVGYYCHVRMITDPDVMKAFAEKHGLDMDKYDNSITVFYKNLPKEISYRKDIEESSFEVIKLESQKYWNERGCRAYRRQLISNIRMDNII